MNADDALILALPDDETTAPHWWRVIDGRVTQSGTGTNWLGATGMARLDENCVVLMLVPTTLVTLHAVSFPDMPVRQGRAAARLTAMESAIGSPEALHVVAAGSNDAADPHDVAIVARTDMVHWLDWARQHGLDPDHMMPAAMLLPRPDIGFVRGVIAGQFVLRGDTGALLADDPIASAVVGDAPVVDIAPEAITAAMIAALDACPLDLREGAFALRKRRALDRGGLTQIAIILGFAALCSLLIAIVLIAKYSLGANALDARTVEAAQTVLPNVTDAASAQVQLDAELARTGKGGGFTGPLSGLYRALQAAPNVSITTMNHSADGTLRVTLAGTRAEDINAALIALQEAGFTITATSSADQSGRVLADITVRTS